MFNKQRRTKRKTCRRCHDQHQGSRDEQTKHNGENTGVEYKVVQEVRHKTGGPTQEDKHLNFKIKQELNRE